MTREDALRKAIEDVLRHHGEASTLRWASTEKILGGLYAGLRVVRQKMTDDTLITNDLTQLIACALDALAVAYADATERGEEPLRPSERPPKGPLS